MVLFYVLGLVLICMLFLNQLVIKYFDVKLKINFIKLNFMLIVKKKIDK